VCNLPSSHGYRVKTRNVLRKHIRERGLRPPSYLLYEYKPGDKVVIDIDPAFHKGMPHRRFQGKVGIIKEKRGRAYIIEVSDQNKVKEIICRPEHIKLFKG